MVLVFLIIIFIINNNNIINICSCTNNKARAVCFISCYGDGQSSCVTMTRFQDKDNTKCVGSW